MYSITHTFSNNVVGKYFETKEEVLEYIDSVSNYDCDTNIIKICLVDAIEIREYEYDEERIEEIDGKTQKIIERKKVLNEDGSIKQDTIYHESKDEICSGDLRTDINKIKSLLNKDK